MLKKERRENGRDKPELEPVPVANLRLGEQKTYERGVMKKAKRCWKYEKKTGNDLYL